MFVEHEIAIPSVLKVGDGMLSNMGEILTGKEISHVVLYFGNGLIDLFGDRVVKSVEAAGIKIHEMKELDSVDIDDIIDLAFAVDNEVQAICGIGGGKVIDAAKYASYLRKMQFISVPTSTSSDGFTSSSASLIVNGRRKSVPAKMAYGIVVDTEVLRTAPVKFIHSGVGDLTAKITSLYDWVYEEQCGVTVVDDFALMMAKKAVNSFVRTPFESITDGLFLKELVDSLAMSGIANEIAGSSAPVSGSEHLISHALDS
nr:iron-containing alcohol dehydrogenase [Lachnospiraceae bacterium]